MATDKFKLYIGGLNDQVKREDLAKEFDRFGKTSNVWVAFNPAGFGFVEYDSQEEADNAIEHMNGVVFLGCKLRVESSHGRTRGGGRGGGRGRGGFGDREDRGFGGGGGSYNRGGGGFQERSFRGRGGGGGYGNKDDSFGNRDGDGYDSGYRSRERGGGRGGGGDRYGGGRGRGSRFSGSGGRNYDAPNDDFNGVGRGGDRYRSRSPGSRKPPRDDASERPRFGGGDSGYGGRGFGGGRGGSGRGGRGTRRPPRDF